MNYIDYKNNEIIISKHDIDSENKNKTYLITQNIDESNLKKLYNQWDDTMFINDYSFFKKEENSNKLLKINKDTFTDGYFDKNENSIVIIPLDGEELFYKLLKLRTDRIKIRKYDKNTNFISETKLSSLYKSNKKRMHLLNMLGSFLADKSLSKNKINSKDWVYSKEKDPSKKNFIISHKSGFKLIFPFFQPKLEKELIIQYYNVKNELREFDFSNKIKPQPKPKSQPKPQSNKLRIFSWNICWEKMMGKKSLGNSCKKDCYNEFGKYFKNKVINKYHLICFQEASDHDSNNRYNKFITNSYKKNNYGIEKHISSKDAIITLYEKNIFEIKDKYYGDLRNGLNYSKGGRPFLILILRNKLNNEIILLCNVHFPHYSGRSNAELILKNTFKNIYDNYYNYNRIIVVGDHNNEYNSIDFTNVVSFDTKLFKFNNNWTKRPSTHSNLGKIDIVSDTKSVPKYNQLSIPRANNHRISDHHPIDVEVDF